MELSSQLDLHHSPYIFASCQVGAEKALKDELFPQGYRNAFSRPGFLTFKTEPKSPSFELKSVFARQFGLSFIKLRKNQWAAEFPPLVASFKEKLGISGKILLHSWARDEFVPGEEPLGYRSQGWAERFRGEIGKGEWTEGPATQAGEWILDVILVEEDEAWVGIHQHHPGHSRFAGGIPPVTLPEEAPSRAYLKLEEAVLWSGVALREGDVAVEIGSAPGGASFALLKRGVRVVGIDPGAMAPQVLRHPGYQHISKPVNSVLRESLPQEIHWLLMDMNVAPRISVFALDRLASRMKESLLGMILTIKLNDWSMASEIPMILEHVKAMGMARVRAAQLYHNRQELCVFGLTRKGGSRLAGRESMLIHRNNR